MREMSWHQSFSTDFVFLFQFGDYMDGKLKKSRKHIADCPICSVAKKRANDFCEEGA